MQHIVLWLRYRALQIHLHGLDSTLELIIHPGVKNRYTERRMEIKRQLHRAEGAYKASLRNRDIWRAV